MAKNDTPEIPGLFDDLPEEAPQEQIAKISLRSWRTHLASIRTLDKRIEKLIDEAVKQALAQGRKLTSADIGRVFQRHPELRAALDKTMQQLNDDLTATIEQGSKEAWLRANTAADAVVAAMANNNAQLAALLNAGTNKPQNDRALRAFQQREMQGLKLSDRVWRATEGMKLDMERAIEVALAEGVPAQKLSERVRELLKEPHRLYRRVRDKDGNLKLSQAAQKYHPGTGVYRSSYKNAMRVARTEVNMAYQASDSERWTRSWWVKGIRVSLSNNHTSLDSKGRPAPLVDICDELAGDYPADFKFTGWHPQCRCFATAITCEYSDIRDYYRRKRAGEDMTGYTPPGTITEPPEQFKRWMADNSDRLAGAAQRGTTPYFIANNAKYTDPNWKPSKASADPMPAPRPKTPLEIADERHARRTAEEAEKIQKEWYERKARNYIADAMADGKSNNEILGALNTLAAKTHENNPLLSLTYRKANAQLRIDIAKGRLNAFKTSAEEYGSERLKQLVNKIENAIAEGNADEATLLSNEFIRSRKNLLAKRKPSAIKPPTPKVNNAKVSAEYFKDGGATDIEFETERERAVKQIIKDLGCSKADAERYATHVSNFTHDGWDTDIRKHQTGASHTPKHPKNEVAEAAQAIEDFIRLSPKWDMGATHRGLAVDKGVLESFKKSFENKAEIDMRGTASWSWDEYVAFSFARKAHAKGYGTERCIFVCEKGQNGTPIRHLSWTPDEMEVLCSNKARYKIISMNKKTYKYSRSEEWDYWEIKVEPL